MSFIIAPIVEGHGENEAIGILLRRFRDRFAPSTPLKINPAIRVHRNRFINNDVEFNRVVELASLKASPSGAVLILLDADEDCPAKLGPSLLHRAMQVRHDFPISVVIAKREYESWFLAAAESLNKKCDLSDNLIPPEHPEEITGAKEWIEAHMQGQKYIETKHQPRMTSLFDFDLARQRSASFDKFYREMENLFARIIQSI